MPNVQASFGKIDIVGRIGDSTRFFLGNMQPSRKIEYPLTNQIKIVKFDGNYLKSISQFTDDRFASLFFLEIPEYLFKKYHNEFSKKTFQDQFLYIDLEDEVPNFLMIEHFIFRFLSGVNRKRTNAFAFRFNKNYYIRLYYAERVRGVEYFENYSPSKELVDKMFPSWASKLVELKKTHPMFVDWLDNQIVGNSRDFYLLKKVFHRCSDCFKNLFVA